MCKINEKDKIMIAAPKSGSGKTLITCAVLELLKQRGYRPAAFKCGPDFIDPLFHKKILGVEGRNLDSFFCDKEGLFNILERAEGDCAVIEGVMGLYDGAETASLKGSCYEIAAMIECPIILVIDAKGCGRTMISLVKGILSDDSRHLIKGIILNRISKAYFESIKPVMESELEESGYEVGILGCMPENRDIKVESRHLGLILPDEIEDIRERIKLGADILEIHTDFNMLVGIMKRTSAMSGRSSALSGNPSVSKEMSSGQNRFELTCSIDNTDDRSPDNNENNGESIDTKIIIQSGKVSCSPTLTLAVARDEAFCFYYKENLEMFEKRGVKCVFFSPVKDERIPAGVSGLLLGGGYPELYLEALSKNRPMLESVRECIKDGIPSLAECGGFMYLHKAIIDDDGKAWKMAGVIDGECRNTGHLVRFGYMQLESTRKDDDLCRTFTKVKGHEFHYYDSTAAADAFVAQKPYRNKSWDCMIADERSLWGFPHLYYPSKPEAVDAFVEKMRDSL